MPQDRKKQIIEFISTSPENGDVLSYNSTTGKYENNPGNAGITGTVVSHLIPDADEAYDLGSPDKKFRDIYMSGNTLYMGGQPLSIVNGALTLNGTPVTGSTDVYNASVINNNAAPSSSFQINKKIKHIVSDQYGTPDPKGAFFVAGKLIFISKNGLEVYKSNKHYDTDSALFDELNWTEWVLEGEIVSNNPGYDYFSGSYLIDNSVVSTTHGDPNILLIGSTLFEFDGTNWYFAGQFESGSFSTTTPSNLGIARSSNIGHAQQVNYPTLPNTNTHIVLITERINNVWTTYQYFREGGPGNTWYLGDVLQNRGYSTISSDGQRIMTTNELTKRLEIYHFDQSLSSQSQNPVTNYILVHSDTTSNTTSSQYPRRGGFNRAGSTNPYGAGYNTHCTASFSAIVDTSPSSINQQQIHFLKWNGSSYQPAGYIDGGSWVFNIDSLGTKAIRHLYANGVHQWDVWEYDAALNTWSQITDTKQSTSQVGFSSNQNLNILTVEEDYTIGTSPTWILYNTSAVSTLAPITMEFGTNPPANRILDIGRLQIGASKFLEFDGTLAYQRMQGCTVYIDQFNWVECKIYDVFFGVNSNGDAITTLDLFPIRKVGNRVSYNYTITQ